MPPSRRGNGPAGASAPTSRLPDPFASRPKPSRPTRASAAKKATKDRALKAIKGRLRPMPTTEQDLQTAYLEAWNAHDPDAVAAFFTADAVYDDRGAGEVARRQVPRSGPTPPGCWRPSPTCASRSPGLASGDGLRLR